MMFLPYIILSILWLSLIAYAVLGGADFGAGMWVLLAFGPTKEQQRKLIDMALGPVWETNHVWLIFLVVGLFSAFPIAFSVLSIVLFVPLSLALLGVVMRGSAFAFRTHAKRRGTTEAWSYVFSLSTIITPFFLGVSAAAVASGKILVREGTVVANLGTFWLNPFALVIGAMAIALCATLAAIYLTVEATSMDDTEMARTFRLRGLIAGAITALLGALGLLLSPPYAPQLWQGMLNHAIPVVAATMIIGLGAAAALYLGYYRIARPLIIAETAFLLGSWGVSQFPYLIPPDLTIDNAAGAPSTELLLLIGIIIGMLIIIPSIFYLFYIFKFQGSMGVLEKGNVPETRVPGRGTKVPSLK
ncbi:MAG: cytochrome d ubiquinol oxidase subunit II [Ktedonobacteraceae bacterium]|nr:cytochrome d ubiquinol oxidase subunit II [Ktedonobacteraceae bacterium]